MLNIKQTVFLFACALLFAPAQGQGQGQASIGADEPVYNFGTIAEADGPASHVFTLRNTGDGPLVITRITASCGCTQPEWTKAPIAPGQAGEVKITYNPKGRPGPFYKTISIFSNAKKGSFPLAIKGHVTPKPAHPVVVYPYSIGPLKLSTKTILYSTVRPDEVVGEQIAIQNDSPTPLTLRLGKAPHYLTVSATPTSLQPGETSQITLLFDARAAKRRGRVSTDITVDVAATGKKEVNGRIRVAANLVDNFTKRSAAEKAQAPVARLSGTLLDFGQLPTKGNLLPLIKSKVSGTFEISNAGKSKLVVYSITCDDELVDLDGGKREIKPGETATYKVSVRPHEIKTKLETVINIVCNDPDGPVRLIKVTAQK